VWRTAIRCRCRRDLTQQEFAAALRSLLEDRFKLAVDHETKALPVYALVMARDDRRLGPRLKRSELDCTDPKVFAEKNADGTSKCGFRSRPGRASGRQTISVLTRFFTNAVADHRPVEDRTGLEGTFDFGIDWTPDVPVPADAPPAPPIDPNGPSLFTAAREQLGLKLEPATNNIDVLVVDHAERPSEN
jgi:uncharacterized protein (TIGR03435 family)